MLLYTYYTNFASFIRIFSIYRGKAIDVIEINILSFGFRQFDE